MHVFGQLQFRSFASSVRAAVLAALSVIPMAETLADTIIKANNSDNLDQVSSWVGGVVPGTNDVAQWDGTVTSGKTLYLGSDMTWKGINFLNGVGGDVYIKDGNTLTLGRQGFYNTDGSKFDFDCPMILSAPQTWYNSSGYFELGSGANGVDTAGHRFTLDGNGTKKFNTDITGGGGIDILAGTVQFASGAEAQGSDCTVYGGTLWFDIKRGDNVRAAGVALRGGTLAAKGDSLSGGVAQTDTITGSFVVGNGGNFVNIEAHSSGYEQLFASNLVREAGGTVLMRGDNLGVYTVASLSADAASLVFTEAPTLTGGGGSAGSTTIDILVGAYADTNRSTYGLGLVTYDTDYGIRLLDEDTEYTSAIVDGQSQLDNVRLANSSGSPLTNTLESATTVNALVMDVSTAGGSGILIDGGGSLTPASGVIFGRQVISSATSADAMTIDGPTLDLGGNEGVVLFQTYNSTSSGIGGGPLTINSRITNDGGNGVTFRGYGVAFIRGTEVNDYTGDTTLQYGNLYLNKSVANASIPANLVVNGGNLINPGNEINDNSDIIINGGAYQQRPALNSGSGSSETFRDLYMTGGSANTASGGTGQGSTSIRNAVLSGGTWYVKNGHKATLSGTLTMCGGNLRVYRNTNNGGDTTRFTVNGGVAITNTASGSYAPIQIDGGTSTSADGGTIILAGDLSFVGNPTNVETTVIAATEPSVGATWGVIRLDGTRTFEIDDGAAEVDLLVQPFLADNGATVGALVKTGAGMLALDGANTFSGGTTVDAGALGGNGSLASDVTVAAGAALAPGAGSEIGTLTVTGNVAFAAGAVLDVDASGPSADLLAVEGDVTGSATVAVSASVAGDGPWLILTADAIEPDFVASDPTWSVSKLAGGTQLWLSKTAGTIFILR